MTISRFSFGWVGAIIMAIFNVLACIGWSTVNVIVGGQLVAALSHGAVPAWVGILIIADPDDICEPVWLSVCASL